MAETQSSSVSTSILAKQLEMLILAYQYDDCVVTPFFRFGNIENERTTTLGFPRYVKSGTPTAGTPASEVTLLGTTELTSTNTDVAVGRVGIAREVTTTVREDSVLGRALEVDGLVMDAARLYGEYFDTTATALFSSITATVGSPGTALTIPTLVALVGSQRENKAKGGQVISLHDKQAKQYQQAQAATTGTMYASFMQPVTDGGQFLGWFMNSPMFASGLNPTSSGDRLGCMFGDGSRPEFSAFAFVVKRLPSSLTETHILMDSNVWASFARTGHGTIANNFAAACRSVNA